jgi:hypothetical protein
LHSGEYKPLSGTHFNKKVVIDHTEHLSVINVKDMINERTESLENKFQLFLKIYFSNIIILFLHAAESQNMTRQISTYLPKHFHINPETRMNT